MKSLRLGLICLGLQVITASLAFGQITPAQHAVEFFHGNCVLGLNDRAALRKSLVAQGGRDVPPEGLQQDAAISSGGGWGYVVDARGLRFIITVANSGGCTVILQSLGSDQVRSALQANYTLVLAHKEDQGPQVSEVYRVSAPSSALKGDLFVLSYEKVQREPKVSVLSYMDKATWERVRK